MFNVEELNTAASYYLVPDPIIHEYREACRVDASNTWRELQTYITGYKNGMLAYSASPLRHEVATQLRFLYEVAHFRAQIANHVVRRT